MTRQSDPFNLLILNETGFAGDNNGVINGRLIGRGNHRKGLFSVHHQKRHLMVLNCFVLVLRRTTVHSGLIGSTNLQNRFIQVVTLVEMCRFGQMN